MSQIALCQHVVKEDVPRSMTVREGMHGRVIFGKSTRGIQLLPKPLGNVYEGLYVCLQRHIYYFMRSFVHSFVRSPISIIISHTAPLQEQLRGAPSPSTATYTEK